MDEHLEKEKRESSNSRNGYGRKTIRGDFGEVEINPPRDRNATFDPMIVEKRSSVVGNMTEKILSLYTRGITTREISEHLEEIYGVDLSESFVSRAVTSIQGEIDDWQQRPLEETYAILYVDGIRFNVKENNKGKVEKKCFYTVLGVDVTGKQDVLGMWVHKEEGASFWLTILSELQQRGVKDILIACTDGLAGMPEAFESVFPETDLQLCIVHQIRNCCKFVSYKDRKAICRDMKAIYTAINEEAAETALKQLKNNWDEQYPAVSLSWERKWNLLVNFLRYPPAIRKITYTTNAVEALHCLFRKNTKNRKIFPSDNSLKRLLYLNIKKMTKKWTKRRDWNTVSNQFSILFKERFSEPLLRKIEN